MLFVRLPLLRLNKNKKFTTRARYYLVFSDTKDERILGGPGDWHTLPAEIRQVFT